MITKSSPTRPIPLIKEVSMLVPIAGGGSMFSGGISRTWSTASLNSPISRTDCSSSPKTSDISVTTILVSSVISVFPSPNLCLRSITGITLPRRFMTPLTNAGILGTRVIRGTSRTSWIFRTSIAYRSSPRKNVKNWAASGVSFFSTNDSLFRRIIFCNRFWCCSLFYCGLFLLVVRYFLYFSLQGFNLGSGQNPVDVQNDDELVSDMTHTPDKGSINGNTYSGSRFNLGLLNGNNLLHCIAENTNGQNPFVGLFPVLQDLDYDYPGVNAPCCFPKIKFFAQINNRDNRAAKIDYTAH